jgi:hypothetical protein
MRYDDDAAFDHNMGLAIRDTEREIFAHATDGPTPDEVDVNRVLQEDLERPEGWDGTPLSHEEVAESTLRNGLYRDRPIESEELAELTAENEALRQRVAENEQAWEEWVGRDEREASIRQGRERMRENLNRSGVFFTDDNVMDAFVGGLQQQQAQAHQLHTDRVNRSCQAAIDKYGHDNFMEAYNTVVSPGAASDPTMKAIAGEIFNSENPGEAVMHYGHSDLVRTKVAARGGRHPFIAGTGGPARGMPRAASRREPSVYGDDEVDGSGFGNANIEADVFSFATGD